MKIITICGSHRFSHEIKQIAEKLALEGNCVLTPIELTKSGKYAYTAEDLALLGQMHKEKIRLSDAIFVANVGGYLGDSTKAEIAFAQSLNKEIIYYHHTDRIQSNHTAVMQEEHLH